jgi:CheY-like chemotaxis protein
MTKILLVEDNEMNRDCLSRLLARRGYEVICAEDGETAIDLAQTALPDIILMDISLPGLDGYQATRTLKGMAATRDLPIIALTAHAMTSDREKAIQAGCSDYETKPIEFPRLLKKIEDLTART